MGNENSPNEMDRHVGIEGYQPKQVENNSSNNALKLFFEGYNPKVVDTNSKKNKKEVPPPKAP